jgi:hypothetical protein
VVCRSGCDLSSFKDFPVRRQKVLVALQWLQKHNRFYHDITITEANLDALPEDGHVDSQLRTILDDEVCALDVAPISLQVAAHDASISGPGFLQKFLNDCPLLLFYHDFRIIV